MSSHNNARNQRFGSSRLRTTRGSWSQPCMHIPTRLRGQSEDIRSFRLVQFTDECFDLVPAHSVGRKVHSAGILRKHSHKPRARIHHALPLRLGDFVFAQVESLCDGDLMLGPSWSSRLGSERAEPIRNLPDWIQTISTSRLREVLP